MGVGVTRGEALDACAGILARHIPNIYGLALLLHDAGAARLAAGLRARARRTRPRSAVRPSPTPISGCRGAAGARMNAVVKLPMPDEDELRKFVGIVFAKADPDSYINIRGLAAARTKNRSSTSFGPACASSTAWTRSQRRRWCWQGGAP